MSAASASTPSGGGRVRSGQTRRDRLPAALDPSSVAVDDRSAADLLAGARRFSAQVRYVDPVTGQEDGTWEGFLDEPREDGRTEPATALLQAFLQIHQRALGVLNGLSTRHQRFALERVLRFAPRPPEPDRAHLLVELKKGAAPVTLDTGHRFSAGKDDLKAPMLFAPVEQTVVGQGSVAELRAVRVDGEGRLRCAPVAASADGLGAPSLQADGSWEPFGGDGAPLATVGFAVAAPVLRMAEGTRRVTVRLGLSRYDAARVGDDDLGQAFAAHVTGAEGWLGPFEVAAELTEDGVLTLSFQVDADEPAVVDHDGELHATTFAAGAPVVQLLLQQDELLPAYRDWRDWVVASVCVDVEVDGVTSLTLEGDGGRLDPKRAFLPFGAEPRRGSRFQVGCPEALSKRLSALTLTIDWLDLPGDLGSWYGSYGSGVSDGDFKVSHALRDGAGRDFGAAAGRLFTRESADAQRSVLTMVSGGDGASAAKVPVSRRMQVQGLRRAGSHWALTAATRMVLLAPQLSPVRRRKRGVRSSARSGFVTLTLQRDFLHVAYRKAFLQEVVKEAPQPPNEPYAPTIRHIELSYAASSGEVDVAVKVQADGADTAAASQAAFADERASFFHVDCFGTRREHGHQRAVLGFVGTTEVGLLPYHGDGGALLVGLADVAPGDFVSLLAQVSQGSAAPELEPGTIRWSVLVDDYWKALEGAAAVRDDTASLLRSGTVRCPVPTDATTGGSLLPGGLVWLKAETDAEPASHCRLVELAANAVEVRFRPEGNDLTRLGQALPAGSIAKLVTAPQQLKAVSQPYGSFGGRAREHDAALASRAAERCRHRDRAVTAWDHERLVLEAFPELHLVKCLPHADGERFDVPGHVLLVVVPDLTGCNGVDLIEPRTTSGTLAAVEAFVRARVGPWIEVRAVNPGYQRVRVDVAVQLRPGYGFGPASQDLRQQLVRFLSPWADAAGPAPRFGGVIHKSVVLDFLEDQACVDHVAHLRLFSPGEHGDGPDLDRVVARRPDAILVSDTGHRITELAADAVAGGDP